MAVTAGYISEKAREEFLSVIDAANIDLKAFTDGFYRSLCSAELKPILETLEYVKRETSVWLQTGGCAMCLERRLPRSLVRVELRRVPGYAPFTPAMFMTRRGRAPIVTPVAQASSAGTGTRSPPGCSMKAVAAGAAGLAAQAFSKKNMGHGGRGGCGSSWAKASKRWSTSF